MIWSIEREDVDGNNIKYLPGTGAEIAVSREGYVYSFSNKSNGGKIGALSSSGYMCVYINYGNGKRKLEYVHRLVAKLYVPNPDKKPQIAHLNDDKLDNRAENLMWCTGKENCNMGKHNDNLSKSLKKYYTNRATFERMPVRIKIMDDTGKVLVIESSMNTAGKWISSKTGKSAGSSSVQISHILSGKEGFRSVGGFYIERATENEFQEWAAKHISEILEEENITMTDKTIKKLEKIPGISITNRRLNMKTGELEVDVVNCVEGEKIKSELK